MFSKYVSAVYQAMMSGILLLLSLFPRIDLFDTMTSPRVVIKSTVLVVIGFESVRKLMMHLH